MISKRSFTRISSIIIGVFLILILANSCSSKTTPEREKKVEEMLKNEFAAIPTMPTANKKGEKFFKKTGSMYVNGKYLTNSDYERIKGYYNGKLKENGWEFIKEENVSGWGEDSGGKAVRYKKGDFIAVIQYAGKNFDYGWIYSFTISWSEYGDKGV